MSRKASRSLAVAAIAGLAALLALLALATHPTPLGAAGTTGLRADWIPARAAGAATGSEFAARTAELGGRQRQTAAVAELAAGNLPDFLRTLVPVRLQAVVDGQPIEATLWVMPDYLAIGSDEDFLRMPLTYPAAVATAARLGFVLPTRKIVDEIHAQATVRLEPRPMTPGPRMRSIGYYLGHQRFIEEQRAGAPLGALTAGHKKDVVITKRLSRDRGRIAIYGWHRPTGKPIQPLSTVHGARYADYSHGVRLVHPSVWLDGEPRLLVELLADPRLSALVSLEGPIPDAAALLDPVRVATQSP